MMVPSGSRQCMICKTSLEGAVSGISRSVGSGINAIKDKFAAPLGSRHAQPAPLPSATNLQTTPTPLPVTPPPSSQQISKPDTTQSNHQHASDPSNSSPLKALFSQGGILDQKFKLGKEIGRGGMGYVHLATDLSLNRAVAVKILPPHYNDDQNVVGRFQREARAMASLDHPNIVTVYSIGFDFGLHYFVMKYLQGETLAHLIKRIELEQCPPLSNLEIIDILVQACNGLEHAHEKNLLHRDIKPGNLMLSKDSFLTIMDFGIVKRLDDSDSVGLKTAHGKIFGTPEYMPPEQAMGKGDYSPASDLYALAIVGYELLCGELPYVADTPIGIIIQHIRADIPPLKGRAKNLYPVLESIFKKALAKEPAERYRSAAELRSALLGIKNSLSTPKFQPIDHRVDHTSEEDAFDFIDEIDSLIIDEAELLQTGLDLDSPSPTPPPTPTLTAPETKPLNSVSFNHPQATTQQSKPATPTPLPKIQPDVRPTTTLRPASERPGHYKGLPFKRKR